MFLEAQESIDTPITKPIFLFYSLFQLLGTLIWGICITGLGILILQSTEVSILKVTDIIILSFSFSCIGFGIKNRIWFAIQGLCQLNKPKLVLYPDKIQYFKKGKTQIYLFEDIRKIGYKLYNDYLFFINNDLEIEQNGEVVKLCIRDLDADEIIIFKKLKTHLSNCP